MRTSNLFLSASLAMLVSLGAAAQNPLARTGQTEWPFAGSFAGKNIALEMAADGTKAEYAGTLVFDGQRYACEGSVRDGVLKGRFRAGGATFEFTAKVQADKLTLTSDGTDYQLERQRNGGLRPMGKDAQPAANGPKAGVGILLRQREDGSFAIDQIAPGGPAAKAKLQPGGILRAVDNQRVQGKSMPEVGALISGAAGTTVTLTIETDREIIDAMLIRAPLGQPPAAPAPGNRGRDQGEQPTAVNTGLPAVIKPGMRLTWWAGSASVAGARSVLVQNANGDWVDSNGQRYAEEGSVGAGGAGYTQLDIVAAGPDGIAADVHTWLISDLAANAVITTGNAGLVGNSQSLDTFWVNPAHLATLQDQNQHGVRILRGPYSLANRTYNSISIATTTGSGYSRQTYDLDTGLCLVNSSSSIGAAVMTADPSGRSGVGAGSTMITHTRLVSVREMQLPWANSALPAWLRQGSSFEYQGSYGTQIPGVPEVPSLPMSFSLRVDRVGNGFATGKSFSRMPGLMQPQESQADRVIGAAVIGGLFVDPRVLQQLRPDQVIDQDPVTGVRTVYAGVQDGCGIVVSQCARESTSFAYDLGSGLLRSSTMRQFGGVGTIQIDLRLARR